jgi:8-oxo-dGTP pyrophosphatase MutT (NUDIX family)
MSYNTQRPHIAAYVIVRKKGKIAFLLRENTGWMNGFYGLASGKVETKESYIEAAIREAKEEIGIELRPDDLKQVLIMHRYEGGDHAPEWVDVYFEALKWEGEPKNAEPDLHSKLVWLDPKNLPENVISSVKAAIADIEAGKTYAEFGWDEASS